MDKGKNTENTHETPIFSFRVGLVFVNQSIDQTIVNNLIKVLKELKLGGIKILTFSVNDFAAGEGKSTYDKVMKGVEMLNSCGVNILIGDKKGSDKSFESGILTFMDNVIIYYNPNKYKLSGNYTSAYALKFSDMEEEKFKTFISDLYNIMLDGYNDFDHLAKLDIALQKDVDEANVKITSMQKELMYRKKQLTEAINNKTIEMTKKVRGLGRSDKKVIVE